MFNNPLTPFIEPKKYDPFINKVRSFFRSKNYLEVDCGNLLAILSACEDPKTVSTYNYMGEVWPLHQTNQMFLEEILLNDKSLPGIYCTTTSYRAEPNPIPGRHATLFKLWEFELSGGLDALRETEVELLSYLGFPKPVFVNYEDVCRDYGVSELTADHELQLQNMARNPANPNLANKIDVILCGIETIGSAERSTDVKQMRETFHTISNGEYAKLLYDKFGVDRVEKELEAFLALDFFPRSGGGIGITRLLRAMEIHGLI